MDIILSDWLTRKGMFLLVKENWRFLRIKSEKSIENGYYYISFLKLLLSLSLYRSYLLLERNFDLNSTSLHLIIRILKMIYSNKSFIETNTIYIISIKTNDF